MNRDTEAKLENHNSADYVDRITLGHELSLHIDLETRLPKEKQF